MPKQHGADAVATAHTNHDQAETILFRLVRGSGPRGLAGIAYRSEREGVRIIRPMLDCRREEILGTLQKLGQRWRARDLCATFELDAVGRRMFARALLAEPQEGV